MIKLKLNFNRGFTLVEMMVAVAVFSTVMVVAATALLSIIDSNQKAQSIKTAINTINFALEGISKDVRVGKNYQCVDADTLVPIIGDCLIGETAFRYQSNRAYIDELTGEHGYSYYLYNPDTKSIESCLESESDADCDTVSDFISLTTSDEIVIDKMNFYVLGVENDSAIAKQPRLIITLEGTAGSKEKTKTTFNLQTTVSQRIRD